MQDFDPAVQRAVNRIQPYEMTRDVIAASRASGFKSLNVDLIYGLPKQSVSSFADTVERVLELRPDRIALYSYAHLPQRFKPQRRILDVDLPSAAEKLSILARAIDLFNRAGYIYIGMDHFALPDDELARAQRCGTLTRNFQGYTVGPDGDMLSFGVSAIGKVGPTYSQNARDLPAYYDSLDQGRLPIIRGLRAHGRRPAAPRDHRGAHVPVLRLDRSRSRRRTSSKFDDLLRLRARGAQGVRGRSA